MGPFMHGFFPMYTVNIFSYDFLSDSVFSLADVIVRIQHGAPVTGVSACLLSGRPPVHRALLAVQFGGQKPCVDF